MSVVNVPEKVQPPLQYVTDETAKEVEPMSDRSAICSWMDRICLHGDNCIRQGKCIDQAKAAFDNVMKRVNDYQIAVDHLTIQSPPLPPATVTATLVARGQVYGDFTENAAISQEIKSMLRSHPNWFSLSRVHKESLDMIGQKIARILNGDPEYKDNWHDIAGYAQLAEARCKSREEEKKGEQ